MGNPLEGSDTTTDAKPARLYLSPPHLSGRERELVAEAFDSNWIAPLGPHVDAFEREFAQVVGVPHAVALSSGTAALHLALQLSGVGPGDDVVCSTLTFIASAGPIVHLGARPLFIDAEETTWNMDPGLLSEELAARARQGRLPKAVIVVDLYGQCADMSPILASCEEHCVTVIEDAAEALGATYRGRAAGSFGRMSAFSFNGNKIITTSGGGMLVSSDGPLMGRARFLATQARDPAPYYQHSTVGYNYRMSNVLAAIGRGQLETLPARVEARRATFAAYRRALGDLPGLTFMPESPHGRSNRWLTVIQVDPKTFGATPEEIRLALEKLNIESRPLWKPLHLQPVFSPCPARLTGVAERLFERGLCLPSGSQMSPSDQARVCDTVRSLNRRGPA